MSFELIYTEEAQKQFDKLSKDRNLQKRFRAVVKALRFLTDNPAHPSLNTHKYDSLKGPEGAEVFEAYAENNTPAAYRIFWSYYPPKSSEEGSIGTITVLAITPHP
ncbi:MAG: hypothetical protein IPM93_09805 [Candidatus Obscuribacter sp.]|nr:hypothetical protein [Candidatus Obscuribacter sp.]